MKKNIIIKENVSTKERILLESLNLFSVKGFDAVSVRDIAKAVGIKESSLYNHYKNKLDIFDNIITIYSGRGESFFSKIQLTDTDMKFAVDDRTINMYKSLSSEQFAQISINIFEFYFTDDINIKLRKMLTIEQYRNSEISKLYRELSFDSSIDYQAKLFEGLIAAGLLIKTDPYILALVFFAPIFLLFYKFDNDKASLNDAKDLFIRHINHFNEIYGTKESIK